MRIRNLLEPLYEPGHRIFYTLSAANVGVGVPTSLNKLFENQYNLGYINIGIGVTLIAFALLSDISRSRKPKNNAYQNGF